MCDFELGFFTSNKECEGLMMEANLLRIGIRVTFSSRRNEGGFGAVHLEMARRNPVSWTGCNHGLEVFGSCWPQGERPVWCIGLYTAEGLHWRSTQNWK